MTPSGARPLAVLVLVLALAACQTSTPSPSTVPGPTATPLATPDGTQAAPSPPDAPSPSATVLPAPEPTPSPSGAPAAQAYAATGEAGDVLFAPDGRIVLVTRDFAANRADVTELDANGAVLPGWPWPAGETGSPVATAALGPDGSVYVAVRTSEGDPEVYTWALHRLDTDARETPGFPVPLPPVAACTLAVAPDGAAHTACESNDEAGAPATTLGVVRPDGSTPGGWPITASGSTSIDGFLPDGSAVVWSTAQDGSTLRAIRPDGTDAQGWPRPVPNGGYAMVDGSGRILVTSWTWEADQCGPAKSTGYTVLATNGSTVAGWPVKRKGWASDPLPDADGSLTVATDGNRVLRFGPDGSALAGWADTRVSVTVGCHGGSSPVAAGDGRVLVVGAKATLVGPAGAVDPGWPVTLPFPAAIECPSCTPGPGSPVAPAVGSTALYIAAYGNDRPRVIALGRDGSLIDGAQRVVGKTGEEIGWIRIAPTGRVWMLLTLALDESTTTRLVPVADDALPGG